MGVIDQSMVRVVKRDSRLQEFQSGKILRALILALEDRETAREVLDEVLIAIRPLNTVTVEHIQDAVELELMTAGHHIAARSFILHREKRASARARRAQAPSEALPDYIRMAKYCLKFPDQEPETWLEAVHRNRDMHHERLDDRHVEIPRLIDWAFELVEQGRILPSMRSMQFGGKAILSNHARMFNCSGTLIDRPRVFQEVFYLLLCGCGVGDSVQWEHVDNLPEFKKVNQRRVRHHSVSDTIEGWADALGELVLGHIHGEYVEFDYSGIRDEGLPLKTSGGLAPGHRPLKIALESIREILSNVADRKLRPIECNDILCHLALAVLSGGIRRSSRLTLFSVTDSEMMHAKVPGTFDPAGLNIQRAMANNSAMLLRNKVTRTQFDRLFRLSRALGEPGVYFSNRIDHVPNPCAEIGFFPIFRKFTGFGFCNLTEKNCAIEQSKAEFLQDIEATAIIGTLQATYTNLPYLGEITEAIARRDALLGVSLTGMWDNPALAFDPRLQNEAAELVIKTNKLVAEMLGINPAARCTTIKPSGTASLTFDPVVASGIHPHHARRYIRRVTANPLEPTAVQFIETNPHMVEHKSNGDLALMFPVEVPSTGVTLKETTALKMLERVFSTYENWVRPGTTRDRELTNNVSCTVAYHPEEYRKVVDTIWENRDRIAAISLAPMTLDKIYPHAPREAVETEADEVRWNHLINLYRKVDWIKLRAYGIGDVGSACEGPSCEI